jgi:hypothetical protein
MFQQTEMRAPRLRFAAARRSQPGVIAFSFNNWNPRRRLAAIQIALGRTINKTMCMIIFEGEVDFAYHFRLMYCLTLMGVLESTGQAQTFSNRAILLQAFTGKFITESILVYRRGAKGRIRPGS